MIICTVCGKQANKRRQAIYCSNACKVEKQRVGRDEINTGRANGVSSGVVGGMHEMLVCVDLLRRGFYVYRSVTQSAPFDLMVSKNGVNFAVEVTTGSFNASGSYYKPSKDRSKFDCLAVVMHDGRIFYEPDWCNQVSAC